MTCHCVSGIIKTCAASAAHLSFLNFRSMAIRTTKKQVLTEFSELWRGVVADNPSAKGDVIAKREAFNDYVDSLNKQKIVSDHQAFTWTNPF